MTTSGQLLFDFAPHDECTFDNFLVTGRNRELFSLLRSQRENRTPCILIWGGAGTGKSHLLQAACREEPQSIYLPMAQVREYGPSVMDTLHHMDLVCIDDMDAVAGEQPWEESLFNFFNLCSEAGNRMIVSSTDNPRHMHYALPDLGSRFNSGVNYHLYELDDDDKLRALGEHARARGLPLDADVLKYIYLRHPRNLQQLMAVVDKLDSLSLAEKRRLTVRFVRELMAW